LCRIIIDLFAVLLIGVTFNIMTQILDDEEVAPGMSQDTKNVRFADDKNNSVPTRVIPS